MALLRFTLTRRLISPLITTLFALLMIIPLRASALGPIILPENSFDQTITQYTSFYEDASAQMTLAEVLAPEIQLRFTPAHTVTLKRGATQAVLWLRLSIHNPVGQPLEPVLTLSNERIDSVRLFDISDVGNPYEVTGPSLHGALSQAHAFSLNIDGKSIKSYLLRVETDALLNTQLALKSIDQFNTLEQISDLITGATLGLVLLVLFYFIYAYFRGDRGLIAAGIICAFSVLLFVPSSIGINLEMSFADALPKGCIETLAVCGILTSQLTALLQLGWRQLWIRTVLKVAIGVELLILASDAFVASYQTELLLYTTTAMIQIFTIVITLTVRSKRPECHKYLRIGAAVVVFGILLVVLHSTNMINLAVSEQLLVFLLPLSIAASVFFAQIATTINRSAQDPAGVPTIVPETMGQISHELRTPINGVIGMSELLSDTPLSVSQRDYLETITMAGRDLLILVNELSDLGKLKAKEVFLESKPVRVINLLNKSLGHFQQEASRKQVELILDLSDDFPEQLLCDRNRLLSVIYNMLSRTLAYTEHGALTMYASYYRGEQAQGLRVQLQLSGTIVKQQELESLFRMLQPGNTKVDGNDPKNWNMTVVRGLIRHMRGTLDIESLSSQGGSITLFVPMQPDTQEDLSKNDSDSSLKGLKVLIVDDNATLRSVIEKQLKRWGVHSDSTYSGKEALAMMRMEYRNGEPYDMVIIDHDMPVMSGLQLAERIRSDDEIPRKPGSLMLTGLSTNSVERSAAAAGIDYVIAKPASGNRLREALVLLQKRRIPAY